MLVFRKATKDDLYINAKFKINFNPDEYYVATLRNIQYSRIRYVSNQLVYDHSLHLDNVIFFHKNGSYKTIDLQCNDADFGEFYVLDSQKEKIQQRMEDRALLKILRQKVDESFIMSTM